MWQSSAFVENWEKHGILCWESCTRWECWWSQNHSKLSVSPQGLHRRVGCKVCARSGWFCFEFNYFLIIFKFLLHLLYIILYMDCSCRKNEQIKVLKSVIISSPVLLNNVSFWRSKGTNGRRLKLCSSIQSDLKWAVREENTCFL